MDNFVFATKNKLRFKTERGFVSVEDLWDMTMEGLKKVYAFYKAELKKAGEEEDALFSDVTVEDPTLSIRLDIIKTIVNTKKEEKAERITAKEKKEEKQKLMEILAKKKAASLENLSIEELEKRIAEM